MGAKVDRSDKGWEISVTPMYLTPKGRGLFLTPQAPTEEDEEKGMLQLHQMHRDIVFEYPDGVEALAYSDRCQVQGMYARGKVITVQGHPEFNQEIVTELLESRHAVGIFDDGMFKDGMDRVGKRHDGVAVSKAFIKFLLED